MADIEEFLNDFDGELGGEEVAEEERREETTHRRAGDPETRAPVTTEDDREDDDDDDDDNASLMETEEDLTMPITATAKQEETLLNLRHDPAYRSTVDAPPDRVTIPAVNATLARIQDATTVWFRRCSEAYHPLFPELIELVPEPLDYANVVLAYGFARDCDLSEVLPGAQVMVVKVSKAAHGNTGNDSSTSTPATDAERERHAAITEAMRCAEEIVALDRDRARLFTTLEAKTQALAPNLYELVGAHTAALLIGLSGGLSKLATMPNSEIPLLGRARRGGGESQPVPEVAGAQMAVLKRHVGVLLECPLVARAPKDLQRRVVRVVSGRVALCARLDSRVASSSSSSSSSSSGKKWREEIEDKVKKWLEPSQGKTRKALPVPDEPKPKRRGGRRARREKERNGMTELMRLANRVKFGERGDEEEDFAQSAMGEDLGMIGKSGMGGAERMRAARAKDNQRLSKSNAVAKRLAGRGGNLTAKASPFDVDGEATFSQILPPPTLILPAPNPSTDNKRQKIVM